MENVIEAVNCHVSQPYKSTDFTHALNICILVGRFILLALHIRFSIVNAMCALQTPFIKNSTKVVGISKFTKGAMKSLIHSIIHDLSLSISVQEHNWRKSEL